MQVRRSFKLPVPKGFVDDLEMFLNESPPKFKYEKEYFYFVAYEVARRQMTQKKQEFASVNISKMKKEIYSNIDKYFKYLVDIFLLERDYYEKGVKSYHYRLSSECIKGFVNVEINPDTYLWGKMRKRGSNRRKNYNRMPEYLKKMKDKIFNLLYDYYSAKDWISTQPDNKQFFYLYSLNQLEDKRFRYFNRNKTNSRLDTNLTSMKSNLLKFIELFDLINIDLKNSQPFIFSQFLLIIYNNSLPKGYKNNISLCKYLEMDNVVKHFGKKVVSDVIKFIQMNKDEVYEELIKLEKMCVEGKFYDELLIMINEKRKDELSRKDVKDIMFGVMFSQNVMFKKNKVFVPYKEDKQIFEQQFPLVYKMIYKLKEKKHNELAIYLQRIESFTFIDTICKRLYEECGITPITIHDSCIVRKDEREGALDVMKSVFLDIFGIIPALDIKGLT